MIHGHALFSFPSFSLFPLTFHFCEVTCFTEWTCGDIWSKPPCFEGFEPSTARGTEPNVFLEDMRFAKGCQVISNKSNSSVFGCQWSMLNFPQVFDFFWPQPKLGTALTVFFRVINSSGTVFRPWVALEVLELWSVAWLIGARHWEVSKTTRVIGFSRKKGPAKPTPRWASWILALCPRPGTTEPVTDWIYALKALCSSLTSPVLLSSSLDQFMNKWL